jgi:hypothetical protein
MTNAKPHTYEGVVTETLHWSIEVTAASRAHAEAAIREHWRDNQQLFRYAGGGQIERLVIRKRRGRP